MKQQQRSVSQKDDYEALMITSLCRQGFVCPCKNHVNDVSTGHGVKSGLLFFFVSTLFSDIPVSSVSTAHISVLLCALFSEARDAMSRDSGAHCVYQTSH